MKILDWWLSASADVMVCLKIHFWEHSSSTLTLWETDLITSVQINLNTKSVWKPTLSFCPLTRLAGALRVCHGSYKPWIQLNYCMKSSCSQFVVYLWFRTVAYLERWKWRDLLCFNDKAHDFGKLSKPLQLWGSGQFYNLFEAVWNKYTIF